MNIKEACEITSPLLILADSDIIGKEISDVANELLIRLTKIIIIQT